MASELRKRLAIVGMTGAVLVGGVLGLSSLASASTSDTSTPSAAVSSDADSDTSTVDGDTDRPIELEEYDGDYEHDDGMEVDGFDEFSTEDQAVIVEFEECIGDLESQLPEDDDAWTDADYDKIDALFEQCEPILDGLSFDADEWLEEGDDWEELYEELSPEDQAVLDRFDECLVDVESQLPEDEESWTDEQFEQLESQFEACEVILDDLSEDAEFIFDFEDCEDYDYDEDEDYDYDEDYDDEHGTEVEALEGASA
ncbi:MAG: hypothetical protein ACRBK7_08540 [Acidimicrobiales bacterium]